MGGTGLSHQIQTPCERIVRRREPQVGEFDRPDALRKRLENVVQHQLKIGPRPQRIVLRRGDEKCPPIRFAVVKPGGKAWPLQTRQGHVVQQFLTSPNVCIYQRTLNHGSKPLVLSVTASKSSSALRLS